MLSAPTEYTLGALSGDIGERRTGEDVTGDITSGILLEILADPLNLVGAGIGAGGAIASKVLRRLDKFNDWNRATERIHQAESIGRRLMDEEVLARQMEGIGGDIFREATPGTTRKRSLLDVLLGDVRGMDVERGVMHHGTAKPFEELDEFGDPIWKMEEATSRGLSRSGVEGMESSRGPGFYNTVTEKEARGYSRRLRPERESFTPEEKTSLADSIKGLEKEFVDSHAEKYKFVDPDDFDEDPRDLLSTPESKIRIGLEDFLERDKRAGLEKALDGLEDLENAYVDHHGWHPEGLEDAVEGLEHGDRIAPALRETLEDSLKARTPEEGFDPTVYKSRIRTDRPLDVREGKKISQDEAARIYKRIGKEPPVGEVPARDVDLALQRHQTETGEKIHEVLQSLDYDSLIHTKEQGSDISDIMTWDPDKMLTGIRRRYRPTLRVRREEDTLRDVLATYLEAGQGLDKTDAARAVGGMLLGGGGMGGIRAMLGARDEEEEI
tara:strand:+ start:14819 stop:16309 length:1491 start_codon:yes stop_codon:yes gene_type:complete